MRTNLWYYVFIETLYEILIKSPCWTDIMIVDILLTVSPSSSTSHFQISKLYIHIIKRTYTILLSILNLIENQRGSRPSQPPSIFPGVPKSSFRSSAQPRTTRTVLDLPSWVWSYFLYKDGIKDRVQFLNIIFSYFESYTKLIRDENSVLLSKLNSSLDSVQCI